MANAENTGLVKNFSAMHKLLHECEGKVFSLYIFSPFLKSFTAEILTTGK